MSEVLFKRSAINTFKKLSRADQILVTSKLNQLNYPFYLNNNINKLNGLNAVYRLRIGNIRVIFEAKNQNDPIWIVLVGYRQNIYKLVKKLGIN